MAIKIIRSFHVQKILSNLVVNLGTIAESFNTEFEEYKQKCIGFGDIPIPPYHIQLEHPSHVETIGRDKPIERPNSARHEELHHTHLWQENCIWEDDDGKLVQWNSTSDSFIVYSYFIDKIGAHHFYIIDLVYDKAHTLIENNSQILKWVAIAKKFRLQNI